MRSPRSSPGSTPTPRRRTPKASRKWSKASAASARWPRTLHAVALADLGRLPVTFTTVDPRALIHNAIWTSGKRAQAQRVTLEPGNLPQMTVPVKWDGARIEQLFTALIENSLRYTPAGGRIMLGLEGTGTRGG